MNIKYLFLTTLYIKRVSSAFTPGLCCKRSIAFKTSVVNMGWHETWSDILSGGNQRWKVTCEDCHKQALSHFQKHVKGNPITTSIFCPLAGDDLFVYLLFRQGYSVTTIDLVPDAVEAMKMHFLESSSSNPDDEWEKEEIDNTIIWKHSSGRATLMVGDALQHRPGLENQFDAVYDKDSFGALPKHLREQFCSIVAKYLKQDGIVYLECKLKDNHEEVKHIGPPYSLRREDLMESTSYGSSFHYATYLGAVYDLKMPMQQTGHILKRK
mmetsp:Transcript_15863/g.29943  ORF Transcript_15863/g.29943 Transcript_15863/m.29943 type:complete len:268 (-) Transcript_15863:180-983(-)